MNKTKKILTSMVVVGLVAAAVGLGTRAFFSDTETSDNNVLSAGSIDLKVSYHPTFDSVPGAMQEFNASDLNGYAIFNFTDMKPGDHGNGYLDTVVTSNDAWACMKTSLTDTPENGIIGPETVAGDKTADKGELQDYLKFWFWNDIDGNGVFTAGHLDQDRNMQGPFSLAELEALKWAPLSDKTPQGFFNETGLVADTKYNLGYAYCFGTAGTLPGDCSGTGDQNKAQTDGVVGKLEFYAVQQRNNTEFTCASKNTIDVVSSTLNFGPTGWGGWSCPSSNPHIISATTDCSLPLSNSLAWKQGASVGNISYPATPFGYTYQQGEEGWIVQNGGTGQSCKIHLVCQ